MNKSNSFSNPATASQSLLRGSSSSLASGPGSAPVPVATPAGPLGPPAASTPPSFQPAGLLATAGGSTTNATTGAGTGADAVPSFSTAGGQWKSDLSTLTSLADSTLLLAMDVSHIPTHLAPASPNVSKFLANLSTITLWLQAAEQALSRAEEALALSAPDLKAWEDQVVRVGALVDEMRVVAGEYSGGEEGPVQVAAQEQAAPSSTTTPTAAQERAQLLGLSADSSSSTVPGARIARVSLATRRGLNTSTHPNHQGGPSADGDSPDNDPTNPYEHLHPHQLVQVQQLLLDDQDSQLDALASVVGRQKHVAIDMHDELEDQVGLLDDMDGQADRVGSRLRVERRRVEEVGRKVSGGGMWGVICVLVLVLVVLLVVF